MSNHPAESLARDYNEGVKCQLRGDLDAAKERFLEVLKRAPRHADALHCLGSIDARQGRLDTAESLVRKAITLNPMQAIYFGTLARILRARRQPEEAQRIYEDALHLDPGLTILHDGLGTLHHDAGRYHEAADCFLRGLEIDPNSAHLYNNLGRSLNNLGRVEEAADALRRAVMLQSEWAEARNNLGHVLRTQGKIEQACEQFEKAVELDDQLASAHENLGIARLSLGALDPAIRSFKRALELEPARYSALLSLAVAYHITGRPKKAVTAYEQALRQRPDDPQALHGLGVVLYEQRDTPGAEAAVRRAIAAAPEFADAHAELAAILEESNRLEELETVVTNALEVAPDHPRLNLEAAKWERRTGRQDAAAERLQRFDLDALGARLAQQFAYELGLLHDKREDVDSAYRCFERANDFASRTERMALLEPERYLAKIDRLHAFFSEAEPASWTSAPALPREQTPVFMYGFPRSGTTLTDLLLDAHPAIQTLEEKPTITAVEAALSRMPGGYPEALASLSADQIDELRGIYFAAVDEHIERNGTQLLVDKLPIRTVHAGLVWRLFPEAKVIFSVRHPCDVCLSGFMQQYNLNHAFANFLSLEGSVRIYDKVMRLWQVYTAKLDIDFHIVKYESLITGLEDEVRTLLAFLGVEWDAGVLDHMQQSQRRGQIFTNSYHQVSQPIYQTARLRWLRWRKYLEPHMAQLRPHIRHFGYEEE